MIRSALFLTLCGFVVTTPMSSTTFGDDSKPDRKGVEFFEKKIRPVLVKHCYECHSSKSKKLEGELLLDTREAIRAGGESGPAVVPGNLEDSLLISAIHYDAFEMPPDEPLPEGIIADFEAWIEMGAPDPRDGASAGIIKEINFEEARDFWAFQPIQKVPAPKVNNSAWPRTDIDRFVLARLESNKLLPVADADPRVLIRRVYFDLIGLPPTPKQVEDFVANPSSTALSTLVDRLFDSPQFGERWGRHWLDVARYGESTGMERNFTFPYAWRYRDYVIKSFNEDKPFNQFVTEQVAGDLLPFENVEQRNEQLIATGLLAIGTKSLNERNKEKFAMDIVDEQIDVTTRAFLGFTVSCARCHDHKFDPIPNEEYYSLAGIFCSTETFYGTGNSNGNRQQGRLLALGPQKVTPVGVQSKGRKNAKGKKNQLAKQLKGAQRRLQQMQKQKRQSPAVKKKIAAIEVQITRIKTQIKRAGRASATPAATKPDKSALLVMAVRDAANPADTRLRIRGEAGDRGDTMVRGFLTILTHGKAPTIAASDSGRLQYAEWLTSKDNPLTARVMVNRIWMHLVGRGIVQTVNNFGANGERPTHPQLLDYLAVQFVENDWSIKNVIRSIMFSRVYQLSSDSNPKAAGIDSENKLLWRMHQRRLEVEAIRDAMLMVSGKIDLAPGKGSIVQSIGDGDVGRNIQPSRFAVNSLNRSVYLPIVRGAVPEMLRMFDFPNPSIIFGQREVTTVPTQALFMMNSPFVIEHSGNFADRVLGRSSMDDRQRIVLAYRMALSRAPTSIELDTALAYLGEATATEDGQPESESENKKTWTGFCQALFACSEFRYVD